MASYRHATRFGRSRSTLVLLVLTSVTVLTLDFRGAGVVGDVRGAASTLFSPLADGASSVTEPFTDAWNGAFGYDDLEEENERLRAQLAEMEGDVAEAVDANEQLDQLAELEGITRYTRLPAVTARVVGGSLTNFEHAISLDRGSDSGIAVGMPVVTGAGLVGRVIAVTGSRSTVQVMTDPAFDLGVRLASSGVIGIGHGTGEDEPFVVDSGVEISSEGAIPDDEVVITSGQARSAFPPDIPIGEVVGVEAAADQLSLILTVAPLADLGDLTYVRVLQWQEGGVIALKSGLVLLPSALVLQAAVVSHLTVLGAHGDLLVLVPIAAGLTVGPDRGAVAGFAAGIAVDLLVTTPFGLTALSYCMVGYGIGAFQSGVLRDSRLLPLAAAVAGAALGTAFWAVAATVVGEEGLLTGDLVRIVLAVSIVAGALVLPALRLARWVEAGLERPLVGVRS